MHRTVLTYKTVTKGVTIRQMTLYPYDTGLINLLLCYAMQMTKKNQSTYAHCSLTFGCMHNQ